MALPITDSPNISSLDFKSTFDVPNLTLTVDMSPSVWIGTGYNNVAGVKFTITNISTGFVLPNPTTDTYDLVPPNVLAGTVVFTLPTAFSAVEWGIYQITCLLTDVLGTPLITYTLTKSFELCRPPQMGDQVNTSNGSMVLFLDIKLRDGVGFAYDQTIYSYKQASPSNYVYDNAIYFPSPSGVAPVLTPVAPPLRFNLISGITTTYSANVLVTYNLPDNFIVKLKYVGQTNKNVPNVNLCQVYCCIATLIEQKKRLAGTTQALAIEQDIVDIFVNLNQIDLGSQCNFDTTQYVDAITSISGCDCSCDNTAVMPQLSVNSTNIVNVIGTGSTTVSSATANGVQTFTVNGQVYQVVYGGTQTSPELNIYTSVNGGITTIALSINLPTLLNYMQTNLSGLGSVLLYSDSTAVPSIVSGAEQTLKTYTLPATTAVNTPLLTQSKDGDEIEIFAILTVLPDSGITEILKLKFGGTIVAEVDNIFTAIDLVYMEARVHRISNTSQFAFETIFRGLGTTTIYRNTVTAAVDLTLPQLIVMTANTGGGAAGLVTANFFQVKLNKKA